jgi:membrane-associated phospholipid phosphatase
MKKCKKVLIFPLSAFIRYYPEHMSNSLNQRTLILIAGLLLLNISFAQDRTYQFSFMKSGLPYTFAGWTALQIYGVSRPASFSSINGYTNSSSLWEVDRNAIFQNSSSANQISDITLVAAITAPIALGLIDGRCKTEGWAIAGMGLEGFFIQNGINKLVKMISRRPRPYVYNQDVETFNPFAPAPAYTYTQNDMESFFSGHASCSAYFTFFAAKVFSDLHPDSAMRPFVWGMAGAISGTTGLLRYKAGKHFFTDIAAGLVFGGALGILIPEMHKRDKIDIGLSQQGIALHLGL